MKRLALVAVMVGIAGGANADFYDGNKILTFCETDRAAAYGYVAGVIDFHEYYVVQTYGEPFFCLPEGVTVRQVTDIACDHIEKHIASRHLGAGGLVQGALNIAFPCP